MSRREDFPYYQSAVEAYLRNDAQVFHKGRKSRKLSRPEAMLLEARSLFREKEWGRAQALLLRTSLQGSDFLNAEKYFLLATSAFFLGDFEQAAIWNIEAHASYRASQDRRGQFLASFNLAVDFSRLGNFRISDHYLKIAEALTANSGEKTLVLEAQACQLSNQGEYEAACRVVERALGAKDLLNDNDRAAIVAVGADIFFRAGKYLRSRELLRSLVETPVQHRERARTQFELSVLEALIKDRPLDAPAAVLRKFPEYGLKWKILHAVQGGDIPVAQALWGKLCRQSPGKFSPDFQCQVESERLSIFYSFVQKYVTPGAPHSERSAAPLPASVSGGLPGRLLQALTQARTPMRKEALIEAIWNTTYDPALDSRFYKLVERLKKSGVRILCKSRAYSLAKG